MSSEVAPVILSHYGRFLNVLRHMAANGHLVSLAAIQADIQRATPSLLDQHRITPEQLAQRQLVLRLYQASSTFRSSLMKKVDLEESLRRANTILMPAEDSAAPVTTGATTSSLTSTTEPMPKLPGTNITLLKAAYMNFLESLVSHHLKSMLSPSGCKSSDSAALSLQAFLHGVQRLWLDVSQHALLKDDLVYQVSFLEQIFFSSLEVGLAPMDGKDWLGKLAALQPQLTPKLFAFMQLHQRALRIESLDEFEARLGHSNRRLESPMVPLLFRHFDRLRRFDQVLALAERLFAPTEAHRLGMYGTSAADDRGAMLSALLGTAVPAAKLLPFLDETLLPTLESSPLDSLGYTAAILYMLQHHRPDAAQLLLQHLERHKVLPTLAIYVAFLSYYIRMNPRALKTKLDAMHSNMTDDLLAAMHDQASAQGEAPAPLSVVAQLDVIRAFLARIRHDGLGGSPVVANAIGDFFLQFSDPLAEFRPSAQALKIMLSAWPAPSAASLFEPKDLVRTDKKNDRSHARCTFLALPLKASTHIGFTLGFVVRPGAQLYNIALMEAAKVEHPYGLAPYLSAIDSDRLLADTRSMQIIVRLMIQHGMISASLRILYILLGWAHLLRGALSSVSSAHESIGSSRPEELGANFHVLEHFVRNQLSFQMQIQATSGPSFGLLLRGPTHHTTQLPAFAALGLFPYLLHKAGPNLRHGHLTQVLQDVIDYLEFRSAPYARPGGPVFPVAPWSPLDHLDVAWLEPTVQALMRHSLSFERFMPSLSLLNQLLRLHFEPSIHCLYPMLSILIRMNEWDTALEVIRSLRAAGLPFSVVYMDIFAIEASHADNRSIERTLRAEIDRLQAEVPVSRAALEARFRSEVGRIWLRQLRVPQLLEPVFRIGIQTCSQFLPRLSTNRAILCWTPSDGDPKTVPGIYLRARLFEDKATITARSSPLETLLTTYLERLRSITTMLDISEAFRLIYREMLHQRVLLPLLDAVLLSPMPIYCTSQSALHLVLPSLMDELVLEREWRRLTLLLMRVMTDLHQRFVLEEGPLVFEATYMDTASTINPLWTRAVKSMTRAKGAKRVLDVEALDVCLRNLAIFQDRLAQIYPPGRSTTLSAEEFAHQGADLIDAMKQAQDQLRQELTAAKGPEPLKLLEHVQALEASQAPAALAAPVYSNTQSNQAS